MALAETLLWSIVVLHASSMDTPTRRAELHVVTARDVDDESETVHREEREVEGEE